MKFHAIFSANNTESSSIYDNAIVIIIDVLRASTTVCAALFHGAKKIIPCISRAQAFDIFNKLSPSVKRNFILCGEQQSIMPEGFDMGNSPLEYSSNKVRGKSIVLVTTNGTKAFHKANQAVHKVVGSFVNEAIVTDFTLNAIRNGNIDKIITVCAGSNGEISIEDLLCAGMFIDNIAFALNQSELTDAARIARDFYTCNINHINQIIARSDHANTLRSKGFAADIAFAISMNKCSILPLIANDNTIYPTDI